MGCGKRDDDIQDFSSHCVCKAVEEIKEAQDRVDNNNRNCKNSCFEDLLSPEGTSPLDTIPFTLQGKDGNYFFATGGIGKDHCFQTVFFRVEEIHEDKCCATLSLLKPDHHLDFDKCCVDPKSLCDVDELERTRHCIEVDLTCFCAIQCLNPNLVSGDNNRGCR
ncbi:CotY/CotZ family spore coat protein [Alteribacillus sp. HJP-4]|uniref:CotY/CotZ family spore coat protein n=1 Tax=Alteribacillus sp. HJP-4 TaxID=2775394 RepID=UPI0035CCED0A